MNEKKATDTQQLIFCPFRNCTGTLTMSSGLFVNMVASYFLLAQELKAKFVM